MPHQMRITSLLIVAALLASAIDTIALTSPAPGPEDGVPPTDDSAPPPGDETDSSSSALDSALFATYKEADSDLVGVDEYDLTWTVLTSEEEGKCYLKGYYDDTVLKTKSEIKSCFDLLRAALELTVAANEPVYADSPYIPSDEVPYCAIECSTTSSASVLSSMQMSIVSAAFALLAFIALNYF